TKVLPGGSLLTQVKFTGVTENKICSAQWYQDGEPIEGFRNDHFELTADKISQHTTYFTFTKDMQTSVTMGFKLTYDNPSTGETEELYVEKTVPIENYSDEWYYERDVNRVLNLVSSVYAGNYTTAYAVNGDYSQTEKEIRSEEHTSELQSRFDLVCRLLLEKKKYALTDSNNELQLQISNFEWIIRLHIFT